jgi:hypothetical protein
MAVHRPRLGQRDVVFDEKSGRQNGRTGKAEREEFRIVSQGQSDDTEDFELAMRSLSI